VFEVADRSIAIAPTDPAVAEGATYACEADTFDEVHALIS
jgi:hypothetical protein